MGLIDRLLGRRATPADRREPTIQAANPENPTTNLSDPAQWLYDWATGGAANTFGPPVTETTAMACSAVFRATSLISGTQAMLPLKIYERTADGRKEAPNHRLAPMLKTAPYPGRPMTAHTWRELWSINTLLWGNHYSIIRYDGAARVVGFEYLPPTKVQVFRRDGQNLYRCELEDGSVEWHHHDDMLHVPGIGFDGIKGVSRIAHFARDSVALAKLALEQIGRTHENSAKPSGALEIPSNISPEGFKRLVAQFNNENVGRWNAGRPVLLDAGAKWVPFQMTPQDLGTIELLKYTISDVSRFFGVPLHLLNETEKATSWGTGLSEQTLAFLIFTMDPDLARIEAELNYKLFNGSNFYCEFDRDALMAMDPLKAAQVAQTEIASGVLLPDEMRRTKNRPPLAGGVGAHPLVNSATVSLQSVIDGTAVPPPTPGKQPNPGGSDPAPTDPTPDPGGQ